MTRLILASLLMLTLSFVAALYGGEEDSKAKPASAPNGNEALEQEHLAQQFRKLEAILLQMAQRLERSSKPEDRERAAILKEAIKQAQNAQIDNKFDKLINLLQENKENLDEIKQAADQSKELADDIRQLINLLLSDNRDAQLKAERERLQQLLKMLDAVIRNQKSVRALTEIGKTAKEALAKSQNKVTKATENVAQAMSKGKDSKGGEKAEGKSGSQGKGDSKQGQGKGDQQGKQGQQGQQGQKGQQGQQGQKGQQGQQGQKKGQQNSDNPQQDTPGKKQVEEAIGRQWRAEEEIKKQNKEGASDNQDKAIEKLEQARRQLEALLRQLREEELQRLLAALEARCREMLALQIEVYDGTVRVDKAIAQNPDRKPTRSEEQHALQLSDREQQIVRLANKAIQILESEGSAVAFPVVFRDVRDDMVNVARRLGKADVGSVTQLTEQDIITALKEMIEALKKAQANKSGNSQGQPSGQQGNQSLIDILAELKMIRSLQWRVNQRTLTYARQYQGEQANDPDIQRELNELAGRQQKIFEVTNNIARGKNR